MTSPIPRVYARTVRANVQSANTKNATARTNTPASISRKRSQPGLLFSINLRSSQLARYLVAFLGVVRAPEGLDPEQTYQVSCQNCSDEGSPPISLSGAQLFQCQTANRASGESSTRRRM